jgi:probable HAF family extracellular repeat protein
VEIIYVESAFSQSSFQDASSLPSATFETSFQDINGGYYALPIPSGMFSVSGDGKTFGINTGGRNPFFSGVYAGDSFLVSRQGRIAVSPLTGDAYTRINGINQDGTVAVGNSISSNGVTPQAFRWTRDGGTEGLGYLNGTTLWSVATAVSRNGNVVTGGSVSASGQEPFRWTRTTGMVGLGNLSGSTLGGATGISSDGSVIVGYSVGTTWQAFRWTAETGMVGMGFIPNFNSTFSHATGVSKDGRVVVGYGASSSSRAFRQNSYI